AIFFSCFLVSPSNRGTTPRTAVSCLIVAFVVATGASLLRGPPEAPDRSVSVGPDTVCAARRKERRVGPGATRPTTAPPHARPAAAWHADPPGRARRRR